MSDCKLSHTIAVDAMGGDRGSPEVIRAVKQFLDVRPNVKALYLVGDQTEIETELKRVHLLDDERIIRVHTPDVIGMDEKPIKSIKEKPNSSLVKTVELVKEGECSAAVSCGNTGSLMACGTLKLRMMQGVERPALGSIWPSREQPFVILDVGANPSTKPEHFVHNAILGHHYAKSVLKRQKPRVGLLSIGTEESKGHELIQVTNEKLKAVSHLIHYIGPIEGFDIFENKADVILCDGFTGNVLLKSCESLFRALKLIAKEEFTRTPVSMLGALLSKGAFGRFKNRLNPDDYGGAPLLGLKGNLLKAHGSSSADAIASALRIATDFIEHDLNQHVLEDITSANQIIKVRLQTNSTPSS